VALCESGGHNVDRRIAGGARSFGYIARCIEPVSRHSGVAMLGVVAVLAKGC